jgi:lipid II:glycine glycyltransferase (peptidoglycan interpeptide bridge formation enzyme)
VSGTVRWTMLGDADEERWQRALDAHPGAPVFQHWGWGEFQRGGGWTPMRLISEPRDASREPAAVAQVLGRRMPEGTMFAWVPGGPLVTDPSRAAEMMQGLHRTLLDEFGRCYTRCNVMAPHDKGTFMMTNASMRRPNRPVNSRYSVFLDLTSPHAAWLKSIRKKHRYEVKRAENSSLEWTFSTDDLSLSLLADVLRQMVEEKRIDVPIYSFPQLAAMRGALGDSMTVVVGLHEGQPAAGALVLSLGGRSHYLAAGSTAAGRKVSASYAMMSRLYQHLQSKGLVTLDLGGIAPSNRRAVGVDHFKLGFGGEVVEYLGEWEIGSVPARLLGNAAVRRIIRSSRPAKPEKTEPQSTEWSTWEGTDQEWDEGLMHLPHYSVYQSSRWGEHRKAFGWRPIKLVARRNGAVATMVQVQTRRYSRLTGLAWAPGGPVGDVASCGPLLRRAVAQEMGVRFVLHRLNLTRPHSDEDAFRLERLGWSTSRVPILSGLSLVYDLVGPDREGALTKNWRHNLRRAQKRPITSYLWTNPSADAMKAVYDSMHAYKGIEHLAGQNTVDSMGSLIGLFGSDCLVVRCDDEDGNFLALRGALVMGDWAWDTFAASTPEGRKLYASYHAFWTLMECCRERGVRNYDMGGIDPIGNRGVYDFKQGTGAVPTRFLGEWEFSQPRLLGLIAGQRIAKRLG